MYLNKAIIAGNLTRDPELKALPSGGKVCSFSLATNRSWKDKDGAKQESVEYHNIVVFGNSAENCSIYLKKGQKALVEGRIQTRSWDGEDGSKKYRTEIIADNVQFGAKAGLSNPGGQGGAVPIQGGQGGGAAQDGTSFGKMNDGRPAAGDVDDGAAIQYPTDDIHPDDIPF